MQFSNSTGGALADGMRRDVLTGSTLADIFTLNRDAKTDRLISFQNGVDRIDLTAFNITWVEVQIKQRSALEFVFTIRGERTIVEFAPAPIGDPAISFASLNADDFIFAEGAADPAPNIILDPAGPNTVFGTDQPDIFAMNVDNSRDVIKKFDPNQDVIDLTAFNTSFSNLTYIDRKPGKVVVQLGSETVVVRDVSKQLTSADLTEDMFLF